jgi:hypothetical protein
MINFFSGMFFMYILGMPLMLYISEPMEEDDKGAPFRFALMWPIAALECIYRMIRGESDDDGIKPD